MLRLLWFTILLTLVACGKLPDGNPKGNGGLPLRELARVRDSNPDPRVVEFELTAAPSTYEFVQNHPTEVWTYNGQLPGPLIEANVGDEIIVHFRNRLPEPTTVHWHGIRLTPEMDGSHLSQAPIPPGESFEYRFTVPDAGLYWYHPHHNGSTQVAMGLYGALLVRGAGEPQFSRERVLVLSDALLDDNWQMVQPDPATHSPVEHAIGVHGNYSLINGQLKPRAELQPNSRERWRVVNACASRYFQLAWPGATVHQIGGDSGLADRPQEINELLLAVGERADLVVTPGLEDAVVASLPTKRIHGFQFEVGRVEPLLELRLNGKPLAERPALPQLAPFLQPAAPVTERRIEFTAFIDPFLDDVLLRIPSCADPDCVGDHTEAGLKDHSEMPHSALEGAQFFINAHAFPDVPVIHSKLGTTETWVVNNHTEMDHPFHLHGFRFLVLDVDGVPPPQRMWKDTVNILGSTSGEHTVRLLVDFDGHPGQWVYHCHILHHQETGMMAQVDVEP